MSFVERQSLAMRRMTRLTNAFSKKVENHEHAIALYFLSYNFIRKRHLIKHQSVDLVDSSCTMTRFCELA